MYHYNNNHNYNDAVFWLLLRRFLILLLTLLIIGGLDGDGDDGRRSGGTTMGVVVDAALAGGSSGGNNPLRQIVKDYRALTRRVTARHILLPPGCSDDIALSLKQKIRNKVNGVQVVAEVGDRTSSTLTRRNNDNDKNDTTTTNDNDDDDPTITTTTKTKTTSDTSSGMFVIDAFEAAAYQFSRDERTKEQGGLIGTLVPQGYCQPIELDRACFNVRLGEIEGPITSPLGRHLLLVSERTNCPQLDGPFTKIIPNPQAPTETLRIQGPSTGSPDINYFITVLTFFISVFLLGGILAELLALLSSDSN